MSDPVQRFAFVQFDAAGITGPEAGRYLVREGDEPSGVLVVQVLGAPAPASGRVGRRRRPRASEPGAALPEVPLTRLTVIRPEPLGDEDRARAWLASLRDDRAATGELAREALAIVNRALDAQRVAGRDPHVADLDPERALAVRAGWGTGDGLADGRFAEAVELPRERERTRRREALAPQERVAAVLGGRERITLAERMLVRARGDIEAGRLAEAALELQGAEAALTADPAGATEPPHEDADALRARLAQLAKRLRERA